MDSPMKQLPSDAPEEEDEEEADAEAQEKTQLTKSSSWQRNAKERNVITEVCFFILVTGELFV